MKIAANRDVLFVFLSLCLQVPLAIFLGHFYDDRVFMATGYLVSSGLNPYEPYNFAGIFPTSIISGIIPAIGYPPPYPILLGLIYRTSFAVTQNIFVYNFALKIPVIAANICLALLVKSVLSEIQTSKKKTETAFLIMLFNPLLLLTSVAWGEFDSLIAVLSLASLYLFSKGKVVACGFLLGLAVALKPIALPLSPLPLLYSAPALTVRRKILYLLVFVTSLLSLYFGPFFIAAWNIPLSPNEWNAQTQMAGGMTFFSAVEPLSGQSKLPSTISFLGYLWIPITLLGCYLIYRRHPGSFIDLAKMGAVLMLFFFLSRTWVSEPNIDVILPLVLLSTSAGALELKDFHLTWIIPLIFMIPNYSMPQLLFLLSPNITRTLQMFNSQFGAERSIAQILTAAAWWIFASKIAYNLLQKKKV